MRKRAPSLGLSKDPVHGPTVGSYEEALSCERDTHVVKREGVPYRGTSLIRNHTTLGPYRRPMPRDLGGS